MRVQTMSIYCVYIILYTEAIEHHCIYKAIEILRPIEGH